MLMNKFKDLLIGKKLV